MSSPRIQPNMEDQPLDAIDDLIRWSLLSEVAGEEPSPQGWQSIQARLAERPRAVPGQSGAEQPWRQFASALQAWAWGLVTPSDANWDSKLAPRERSYLIWRENLLLSSLSTTAMIIY
jgi:hypothetical protein